MALTSLLKIENVFISYGPVKAVNDVSFEVNEGEIIALIGPNGSGKSTLLESICGINKVEKGKIFFKGKDITNMQTDKIIALGISLIPEGHGIISQMKVLENLQLGFYNSKLNFNDQLNRVYEYFPVLNKLKNQIANNLSGGEQQMLSIGRGVISNPKIILLDEPSLGLSPLLVSKLFKIIYTLNNEGHTILLAEQNTKKTLQIAHRCYLFEKGKIVISGETKEMQDHPLVRKAYFGG